MRIARGDLSRWFEQRTAIITPSPFLAAVVRHQFVRNQLAKGTQSWNRPTIASVDAWLVSRWSEARYTTLNIPALLSPSQEHLLWRHVIEHEQSDVFDLDAAADLCRRASRLIAEWRIPFDATWSERESAQQLQHWLKLFRRRCDERGWIARSDLWRLVPEWMQAGDCQPGPAILVGFEHFTPALKQLGIEGGLKPARSFSSARAVAVTEYGSLEEEIEHAARWARFQFEKDASRSLAIFVPGLAGRRALIARAFNRVFYPSRAAQPASPAEELVFSINAGETLADHPLVGSALLVLDLAHERIPSHAASALLRCPFLSGAQTERSQRALADLRLRKWRQTEVTLRDLERASEQCPVLQRAWARTRRVLRDLPASAGFSRWSEIFGDLLRAVRWPGDAELTAREQEVAEAWQDALSELASLGLVSSPVSLDATLSHLRRLLSRTLNQANLFAPIQVLDSADAPGLAFDAAFLAGMSEENWPPRLNLNPLVPMSVQRAYGVPGSSAESAQRERQRLTEALLSVAPAIEISYSGIPSSSIRGLHAKAQPQFWRGKLPLDSFAPAILEAVDDTQAPPLVPSSEVRGGTSLIKSQSQCPFRSFAEIRLRAGSLEEAALGLDSRDRGTFLHKALQGVWQELRTLDRLRATTEEGLREIVRNALVAALDGRSQLPLEQLAKATERERLEEVILEWLALEREREHPFTVEMIEQEREHTFAGLKLKLRIDRIDRLENGRLLLLDYKSGTQNAPKWQEDRPQEPQLLVYAAALGNEVDGMFLCQLKPRDMKPLGCSREKQFAAKSAAVEENWDAFLASASGCVKKLASDFVAGFAVLDPAKHACDYCNLKPLCRICEQDSIREDEPDE